MQQDNWLEIPDDALDAAQIQRRVEQRLAQHPAGDEPAGAESPAGVMAALRRQMFGPAEEAEEAAAPLPPLREADIVPRAYHIDWRNPVLGPLNALLRRFVNLEIRRSIYPALEQQSALNRQILAELRRLRAENEALRQQLDSLHRLDE